VSDLDLPVTADADNTQDPHFLSEGGSMCSLNEFETQNHHHVKLIFPYIS